MSIHTSLLSAQKEQNLFKRSEQVVGEVTSKIRLYGQHETPAAAVTTETKILPHRKVDQTSTLCSYANSGALSPF